MSPLMASSHATPTLQVLLAPSYMARRPLAIAVGPAAHRVHSSHRRPDCCAAPRHPSLRVPPAPCPAIGPMRPRPLLPLPPPPPTAPATTPYPPRPDRDPDPVPHCAPCPPHWLSAPVPPRWPLAALRHRGAPTWRTTMAPQYGAPTRRPVAHHK